MNERIRELAEQAGAEIHGHPDYSTICVNGQDADALMKKFAELIVQECCQLIDDSTPVYSPENLQEDYCKGKLDGYHAALLEIREHFGVDR